MDLQHLSISRAVLFDILPDKQDRTPSDPIGGTALSSLPNSAKLMVASRIAGALGKNANGLEVSIIDTSPTSFFQTACKAIDSSNEDFLILTREIAVMLAAAQSNKHLAHSKLMLIQATVTAGQLPCLIAVKAELQDGLADTQTAGCTVLADTPCEIQIRTLVQHAYAEFVHDRVYKPGKHVPAGVRRLVARAMAMLESTDLIFSEATNELACINLSLDQWMELSESVYSSLCGQHATQVTEADARLLFETFIDLLASANSREVEAHFRNHAMNIKQHRDSQNLFGHPFIVVLMWVVAKHDQLVAARWTMEKYRRDIRAAAGLLGIAL